METFFTRKVGIGPFRLPGEKRRLRRSAERATEELDRLDSIMEADGPSDSGVALGPRKDPSNNTGAEARNAPEDESTESTNASVDAADSHSTGGSGRAAAVHRDHGTEEISLLEVKKSLQPEESLHSEVGAIAIPGAIPGTIGDLESFHDIVRREKWNVPVAWEALRQEAPASIELGDDRPDQTRESRRLVRRLRRKDPEEGSMTPRERHLREDVEGSNRDPKTVYALAEFLAKEPLSEAAAQEAKRLYRELIELGYKEVQTLVALAKLIDQFDNNAVEAKEVYASLLTRDSLPAGPLADALDFFIRTSDFPVIDSILARPEIQETGSGRLLHEAGIAHLLRGNFDAAFTLASRARIPGASSPPVDFLVAVGGLLATKSPITPETIALARKVIDSKRQPAIGRLFVIYLLVNHFARAKDSYQLNELARLLDVFGDDSDFTAAFADPNLISVGVRSTAPLPHVPRPLITTILNLDDSAAAKLLTPRDYIVLGGRLMASDDPSADNLVQAGMRIWPTVPEIRVLGAIARSRYHQEHVEARDDIIHVLDNEPSVTAVVLALEAFRNEAALPDRAQAYDRIIYLAANRPIFLRNLAVVSYVAEHLLYERHNYTEAYDFVQRGLDAGVDPAGRVIRAQALALRFLGEDATKVLELYRRALAAATADRWLRRTIARDVASLGEIAFAREIFTELLSEPSHEDLVEFGNFVLWVDEDLDEAEALWRRALDIDPSSTVAASALARLMGFFRYDYNQARYLYERALSGNPSAYVVASSARFYREVLGDVSRAESILAEHSARLQGHVSENLVVEEAGVLAAQGKAEAAEALLVAFPGFQKSSNLLSAYALFLIEDEERSGTALSMADRALRIARGRSDLDILSRLALFYRLRVRDLERAEQLYAEVSNKSVTSNQIATANLAQLLLARNEIDPGLSLIRDLRAARPRLFPAVEVETLLYEMVHGSTSEANLIEERLMVALEAGARSPGWDFGPTLDWLRVNRSEMFARVERLTSMITSVSQE